VRRGGAAVVHVHDAPLALAVAVAEEGGFSGGVLLRERQTEYVQKSAKARGLGKARLPRRSHEKCKKKGQRNQAKPKTGSPTPVNGRRGSRASGAGDLLTGVFRPHLEPLPVLAAEAGGPSVVHVRNGKP
jgi:hypothetical protein